MCPGMLMLLVTFFHLGSSICEITAMYLDPFLCTSVEDDISNSYRHGNGLL